MPTKNSATRRPYSVLLLALLTWASVVSFATASPKLVAKPDLSVEWYNAPARRNLRTYSWEVVNNDDESSEDRGFEGFDMITAAAKKLGMQAKLKLTSNNQEAVNKLFVRFKVGSTNQLGASADYSTVLDTPQFRKWAATVAKSYRKNPELVDAVMLSTLVGRYGDEDVARMLTTAITVRGTEDTAKALQNAQFSKWASEEKTADDVFKLFKLNQVENDRFLLHNPMVRTWISYVEKLGEDPYQFLFLKLKMRYRSDEGLARMLVSAKEQRDTRTIASNLENVQFKNWRSERKSADDVFKLLKLDSVKDNIFNDPMLSTWISYVQRLGKDSDIALFGVLRKMYNDEALASLLVAAKQNPDTWFIANGVEAVEIRRWIKEGKTTDDVFKLLNLDSVGDKLFQSPALSTLTSYLNQLDKENSISLLISALKARYDDDALTKMLSGAQKNLKTKVLGEHLQEMLWLSNKTPVDEVFKFLKLDKEGENVLGSPAFITWVSYVAKVDGEQYGSTVMSKLKTIFGGDFELARALHTATQDSEKMKPVEDLLFKEWVRTGWDPARLSKKKGYDPTKDMGVVLAFHDYYVSKVSPIYR